jgi:hypothetical protein
MAQLVPSRTVRICPDLSVPAPARKSSFPEFFPLFAIAKAAIRVRDLPQRRVHHQIRPFGREAGQKSAERDYLFGRGAFVGPFRLRFCTGAPFTSLRKTSAEKFRPWEAAQTE